LRVAILSRERISHVFWKTLDSYRNVTEEAFQVLETFGLKDKANVLASELPGGMRKLLDVAVAYALNPKVLLLDEPTSGVASREKHDIMKIIVKAVKDKRIASLIIEHDMEIVYNYSDRAVVFFGGKIIAEGKPEEVLENAEVQEKILGCKGMSNLLSVENANFFIGPLQVLREVSLNIAKNESIMLIGRNGAGKTSTLKTIMGLYMLTSGRIVFDGADITKVPAHIRASKLGIAYSPEDSKVFPDLTVEENIKMGLWLAGNKKGDEKDVMETIYNVFPEIKRLMNRKRDLLQWR
jgi:branched-chain amino acid transport system ATP-binding protein